MKRILCTTLAILLAACGADVTVPISVPDASHAPRIITSDLVVDVPQVPLLARGPAAVSAASVGDLLYDQGPETGTTYAFHWQNLTSAQNFSDSFVLPDGGSIHTLSIFNLLHPSQWHGQTVHIKILAAPGGPFVYEADTTIDAYELYSGDGSWGSFWEVRAVLPVPFEAEPGVTYWIGMSGNEADLAQAALFNSVDSQLAVYSGRSLWMVTGIVGDQMFRLYGPSAPTTREDCKNGGWERYGFANQGLCVRFVETGKDSR